MKRGFESRGFMKRLSAVMSGVVLAVTLTGCVDRSPATDLTETVTTTSGGETTQAQIQTTAPVTLAITQSVTYPQQLVAMELTDGAGNKLDLKSLALGKPSIMIFWSSW